MAEPDINKVKRNIEKMIGMGAPESDIDAYIAGEGVTLDQLRGAPKKSSGIMDTLKASPDPIVGPAARALTDPQIQRQLGLAGRYMAEGPLNVAAMFGDAANTAINMGSRGVNEAYNAMTSPSMSEVITGERKPLIPYLQNPSQTVSSGLEDIGFPKPENATERIVAEPSKFLSSIPAFAGTAVALGKAGVQGLAPLTEKMLGQGVGAVTGGLGYGATKEVTDNPFIQAGVGLATGLAGNMAVARLAEGSAKAAIPSTQKIKDMSRAAYKASEEAGAIVKPEAIQRLAANITDDLAESAYIPINAPQVGGVMDEIKRISQGNVTLKGLDALRQAARDVANSTNKSEARLGLRMVSQIDDLVNNLKPGDLVQGDKAEAVSALLRARTFWNNAGKAEILDEALDKAVGRAAVSGTGGNQENAIRQGIERIVQNPKLRRAFTKTELDALRQVARGSITQNVLRQIGRFSPRTGALMQAYLPAAAAMDIMTGVPIATTSMAAGTGAKLLADSLNKSAATGLSQSIRGAITGTNPEKTRIASIIARLAPTLLSQTRSPQGAMAARLLGVPSIANEQPNTSPQGIQPGVMP